MPIQATRRMVTDGGLQFRSSSDGVTVEGYASTANQPYDMGWYSETVASGAFARTLKSSPDVRFLINHDGLPLARTNKAMKAAGTATLELSEDSTGLNVRSVLDPSDPDVQRIVPKMQRGDLDQMSFAFGIVEQEWSEDRSKRQLQELSLAGGDVSIVTYPANPNAGIALRMRELAAEDPEKLRTLYGAIADGSAVDGLTVETTARLMNLLESLGTDDPASSSLVDLSDLMRAVTPTAEDAPVEEVEEAIDETLLGRSVRDIRNLIALARR